MSRQPIYTAADPIEAEIVRNLLATERIECDVFGSMIWSGRGELAADAYPRLMLRDARDEPRARELLHEYTSASTRPQPAWTCTCGESVPGNFAACWSCGGVPS
jgi:hypothetical protein